MGSICNPADQGYSTPILKQIRILTHTVLITDIHRHHIHTTKALVLHLQEIKGLIRVGKVLTVVDKVSMAAGKGSTVEGKDLMEEDRDSTQEGTKALILGTIKASDVALN